MTDSLPYHRERDRVHERRLAEKEADVYRRAVERIETADPLNVRRRRHEARSRRWST
jgi:hypothetical protein